jgi:hypothetical protein
MSTQTLQQLQHLSVISKVTAGEVYVPSCVSHCTTGYMRAQRHTHSSSNSSRTACGLLLLLLPLVLLLALCLHAAVEQVS